MLRYAFVLAVLATVITSAIQKQPERHKVIIVGAGVSGFTAAATLLEHNVTDVLVLEASDRIGGRVHTVEFDGVFIDKGAEFVHGQNGNSVYELIKDYDFLTSYRSKMTDDSFIFANTSGFTFDSTVKKLVDEGYAIFDDEAIEHFNGTMAEYFYPKFDTLLQSKNVDPYLKEAIHYLVPLLEMTETAGDELSELGAWGFGDIAYPEGDITLKWKPETKGYKTLFDVLSKKFPNPSEELPVMNKTLLDKLVTQIEHKDGEVEVTCADGSIYLADHVIVTVSLGVLKKHAAAMFKPALSPEKTTAIEAIEFGCLAKILLLFPTKWWPNNTYLIAPLFSKQELQDFIANTEHGSWTSRSTGFEQVMNHERMLLSWLSGKSCRNLDTLTDEQVIDGMMELITKLMGNKFDIPRPEGLVRSKWGTYPYTQGSYSYRTMESDKLNITNDVLAEPIFHGDKPVVLFAGEATNRDRPGLVNGALDTGRREAQRLINYLKN